MPRLGLVSENPTKQEIIDKAREMNPEYPGVIDGILWKVGREYCHNTNPDCESCPLKIECKYYLNSSKDKSEDDVDKLNKMAVLYGCDVIHNNYFMPLWFMLSCPVDGVYNSLELANIFYESALFACSEPDFLIQDMLSGEFLNDQWGLRNKGQYGGVVGVDVKAVDAWSIASGKGIVVAVVDHGIELNHPDLKNNIHPLSYDTETCTSPSIIRGNHGTACAGIIGAENNGHGVVGVAPNCQLMSISNRLVASSSSIMALSDGINWAVQNGADVISNSWRCTPSQLIDDAIENALNKGRGRKGCVVVFASGNSNEAVCYPANSSAKVLAVGAVTPCGERKSPYSCDGENWGSNYGSDLSVVAPGVLVPTTDRRGVDGYNPNEPIHRGSKRSNDYGRYDYTVWFNGTSAACPHVAGVAALVLSVRPELTAQQVKQIIERTARKVRPDLYNYTSVNGHSNGTWNQEMGYGLVDAFAAVQEALFYGMELAGPTQICNTGTFTLTNLPAGATVQWGAGGGRLNAVELASGQGTAQATYRATDSGRGNVQVTVSLNGASTTLSQTVWAGAPSAELDVSSDGIARASACLRTDPLTMHAEPPVWQLWNPSQRVNFVEDEDGRCGRVRNAAGDWNIRGTVTVRNGCGEATGRFSMSGTSQTDPCPRLIEQRGSGSNLTVMYTKPIDCPVWPIRGLEQPTSVPVIEVYDRMGRLVLRQRGEQVSLGSLRPGLYIVRARSGEDVATLTVVRE